MEKTVIKIITLMGALSLIFLATLCLQDSGEVCPLPITLNSYYFYSLLVVVLFILAFVSDNELKIVSYLVKFLILIFGIYGVVAIQGALQKDYLFEIFRIFVLVLIFIVLALLLDFDKSLEKLINKGQGLKLLWKKKI